MKLALRVQVDNKGGHFDLNPLAEDILLPVFRVSYDSPPPPAQAIPL